MNIVNILREKNYMMFESIVHDRLEVLVEHHLNCKRKSLVSEMFGADDFDLELLDEAPRVKIVKARIRNGVVQRRKKVSNVTGYTFRMGRLKRMTPVERRNRKLGQRRGKIKRRATINRALMKRKRSLRKRRSIGL